MKRGELIFLCGKMGAGKSTLAKKVSIERNAVLVCEDEWLESIYPKKIRSLDDYVKYSNLLKPQMKRLMQSILITGVDVVMDFPANTLSQRNWFRQIFSEINAPHNLFYLDVPNEVCLKQIAKRNVEQPERAATDTEEMFEAVTKFFSEPKPEEGFNVYKLEYED